MTDKVVLRLSLGGNDGFGTELSRPPFDSGTLWWLPPPREAVAPFASRSVLPWWLTVVPYYPDTPDAMQHVSITAPGMYHLYASFGYTATDDWSTLIGEAAPGWKYLITTIGDATDYSDPDYDDSAWATGQGAFGNSSYGSTDRTAWPAGTRIWLRRTFTDTLDQYQYRVSGEVDSSARIFWNGNVLADVAGTFYPAGGLSPAYGPITVPDAIAPPGRQVIAVNAVDDGSNPGTASRISLGLEGIIPPQIVVGASYAYPSPNPPYHRLPLTAVGDLTMGEATFDIDITQSMYPPPYEIIVNVRLASDGTVYFADNYGVRSPDFLGTYVELWRDPDPQTVAVGPSASTAVFE